MRKSEKKQRPAIYDFLFWDFFNGVFGRAVVHVAVRVREHAVAARVVVRPRAAVHVVVRVQELAAAVLSSFVPLAHVLVAARVRDGAFALRLVGLPVAFVLLAVRVQQHAVPASNERTAGAIFTYLRVNK